MINFQADKTLTIYGQRDYGKIFVKSNVSDDSGHITLIDLQLEFPKWVQYTFINGNFLLSFYSTLDKISSFDMTNLELKHNILPEILSQSDEYEVTIESLPENITITINNEII